MEAWAGGRTPTSRPVSCGVVQFTRPGSHCSINFGENVTTGVSGSLRDLQLTVSDIDAARAELVDHGVDVGEIFHDTGGVFHHAGTEGRAAGPAPGPRRATARSPPSATPTGNGWLLQEIKTRLPGR